MSEKRTCQKMSITYKGPEKDLCDWNIWARGKRWGHNSNLRTAFCRLGGPVFACWHFLLLLLLALILMSSIMALTYTHPAHIYSSHYPLCPLSFLPVTGESYFKIIKNPLKSRLRNVMISLQASQTDTTGRHWGYLEGGSQSSSPPPAGASQSTVCIWCPGSHMSVRNRCLTFIFPWRQLFFKWHPSDYVWSDIYFISTITLFLSSVASDTAGEP